MLNIGDMVNVRDPSYDYQVPQAKIVEVKSCPVLITKRYLLKFENGSKEWFNHWEVIKAK